MDQPRANVISFLKEKRMDPDGIDMESCVELFMKEMERGLEGGLSSLRMIPTFIDAEKEIPLDRPAIALDAGGTNFRVAEVRFQRGGPPAIERFSLHSMPGLDGEVSKREFFETVVDYMRGVLGVAETGRGANIGFCFSYPTEILPSGDGRLIRFSKEVKAKEVEGELIGKNLLAVLRERGFGGFERVVVLNDTVATLLAGRTGLPGRVFDGYVGFILGTGTNCCYVEKNVNIAKRRDLDPRREQIINVESGGFEKGPGGAVDAEFDKTTADPGKHTFEKMISGAYFGPLCLKTVQAAAEEGLFSRAFSREAGQVTTLRTKDVNDFLLAPALSREDRISRAVEGADAGAAARMDAAGGGGPIALIASRGTGEDLVTLFHLVERLVERAAKLTAVNISSVVLKSERGKNPRFPVCVTAEGSTFHGLRGLKQMVECYLKSYLVERRERYFEFASVENATLIGAAIAGLTN
jgi:hexokinase